MRPEFKSVGSSYILNWPNEEVRMKIDRLRDGREGDVTAEVTVIRTGNGLSPHLHQARLNLTSSRARKELSKILSERHPLEWEMLVEQACVLTLEAYRQGEPVFEVGDHGDDMPMPTIEYQLTPILQKGQPTVLFGDGGVGKSYLAILMGLLIEYDWKFLGWTPTRTGVLYLDYETDQSTLERRVRLVANGLRQQLDPQMAVTLLRYRRSYQAFADDIAELQQIVSQYNIGTIIVDSVAMASGADPQSPNTTLRFFAALRSLNVSSILLAHESKNALTKTAYGSVFWHNYARNVFEIRREYSPDNDCIYVVMLHRKVNDGRLLPPFGLKVTFDITSVRFTMQDIAQMPELSNVLPVWKRIASALQQGPLSVENIAETIGKKEDQVRSRLNEMKGRQVERNAEGNWYLKI